MKTVCIIPARYQSSRFPGKPLVKLLGKPMILHVAEIVTRALPKEQVYVATDDRRITEVVEDNGYQVIMTTSDALTGTDRLWQAAQQVSADIYINVQGDEPLIDPGDIQLVIDTKIKRMDGVINGMCPLTPNEDPDNVNIPKLITTEDNRLVYMSRLPVPGLKAKKREEIRYMKQVCIYAFTYEELESFGTNAVKGPMEDVEDIEILRFLEMSMPVYMVETSGSSLAVDVPEDVAVVEKAMREQRGVE